MRPRDAIFRIATFCAISATSLSLAPQVTASSPGDAVIALTNSERRRIKGDACPDLVPNAALTAAAERHAADMARRNYFSHTSRSGASPWSRIRTAGYRGVRLAENIAAGQPGPAEVVQGWMASPSHRAIILDCRLREIGVGYANNPGSGFTTYWVQDLGARP